MNIAPLRLAGLPLTADVALAALTLHPFVEGVTVYRALWARGSARRPGAESRCMQRRSA